ncbi:peptidase, S9C family protein [Globomyces pollinis-pini]|nr:peptidase, S9C family protein [Globomyces pollinis-pini]
MAVTKSFGTWDSPISAESLTKASKSLSSTYVDKVTGDLYVVEGRPDEQGRSAVLKSTLKQLNDADSENILTELDFIKDCTTGIHEYGGAPLAALDGIIIYVEATKQLYLRDSQANIIKLNDGQDGKRYADFDIHPSLKFAVAICEDHSDRENVKNSLALIDFDSKSISDICSGEDFYTCPRFSSDGNQLAWISWNHPSMQWNASALYVAEFRDKAIFNASRITKSNTEGISSIVWSSATNLYFASDSSGWNNIMEYSTASKKIEAITNGPYEYSQPAWMLGDSTYDLLSDGTIVAVYTDNGEPVLAIINPTTKEVQKWTTEFTNVTQVRTVPSHNGLAGRITFISSTATKFTSLYSASITTKEPLAIRVSTHTSIDPEFFSTHQYIKFQSSESKEDVHLIYYPPKNPGYVGLANELPPCIIRCHGGPTSHTSAGLSLSIQYYTTRGFAFAEVNYGGSSNYGTKYRDRLNGQWGVVDVEDTCSAALYLNQAGLADRKRLFVTGGSAGGYLALSCLAYRPEVFTAGTSHYGVSDLKLLAGTTHKFESHYLNGLVGGSLEEIPEVYYNRSPINFVDQMKSPLLILQGSIDAVVPPSQAESIVESLKKQGLYHEYYVFEGEGHGFRKGENIQRTFELELAFYLKMFDYQPQ